MDSKLKYYLQMADNASVFSKRLLEENVLTFSKEKKLQNEEWATILDEFAKEIYLETSTWNPPNRLSFSHWIQHRSTSEFYNCLLAELSMESHFGKLVQQFFFETYTFLFLFDSFLREDLFIKKLAEKYIPHFHRRMLYTKNEIEQLQNESADVKLKIQELVLYLWRYVEDLFQVSMADIEMCASKTGVDFAELRTNWEFIVGKSLTHIHVFLPIFEPLKMIGKEGQHTETLASLIHKDLAK